MSMGRDGIMKQDSLKRKIKLSFLIFLYNLAIFSCSHIDSEDRLVYERRADAYRKILIEDFTGQRCINCPNASEEIERLHMQFGKDTIIAVAIHSGPLGFSTNNKYYGLKTEIGDEYYNHWNPDYQPIGMVNRHGLCDYTSWNAKIREEIQKPTSIQIYGNVRLADNKIKVSTEIQNNGDELKSGLQLWIVEDNIPAFQLMPDGTMNENYLHQHVLRTAVNGVWGERIVIPSKNSLQKEYEIVLDKEWKVKDIAVVVFVCDDSGVLQVTNLNLK